MPVLPGIGAKDMNDTWFLLLNSSACSGQLDTKQRTTLQSWRETNQEFLNG